MSLVGNLEDLGLGEILQIVSLSRKSGVLSLQCNGKEGKIFFHDGQVVRANTSTRRENLGEALLRKDLIDLETLKKALQFQQQHSPHPRLGEILSTHFNISRDAIEAVVKEQVELIVYSFFAWSQGTFSFSLGEDGALGGDDPTPLPFVLDQGLNPQWLAMEGSRILDEKLHRGETLEDEPEGEAAFDIEELLNPGSTARLAADSSSGNEKGGEDEGRDFLEGKLSVRPPDSPESVERPNESPFTFNLGAELRREFGEQDVEPVKTLPSPGLHLLREMLVELQNPSLGGGIILLALRFASELMNRAVVFAVKEPEIIGLGQFGLRGDGESADSRIRRMRFRSDEPSVFKSLIESMTPVKVAPGSGDVDSYIQEQLGGGRPKEIFLGPILSEGKVVAILYGDNIPEQTEIGDTESLEIFLSQAGLAMEKALLERRLRSH